MSNLTLSQTKVPEHAVSVHISSQDLHRGERKAINCRVSGVYVRRLILLAYLGPTIQDGMFDPKNNKVPSAPVCQVLILTTQDR